MLGVVTRPCLTCGTLSQATRCPPCTRAYQRTHRHPTNVTRTAAETRRRAEAVAAWVAINGRVCPGWNRPAHPVTPPNDLTADHVIAVAAGGAQDGPLVVLCRVCNGAKQAR